MAKKKGSLERCHKYARLLIQESEKIQHPDARPGEVFVNWTDKRHFDNLWDWDTKRFVANPQLKSFFVPSDGAFFVKRSEIIKKYCQPKKKSMGICGCRSQK